MKQLYVHRESPCKLKYDYWTSDTKIKKNKPKPKPFPFLTAFLSQIVRVGRCDIKMSQVAPCKLLKHSHLEFTDEH